MILILENGSNRQQQSMAWGPDVHGPYAPELSLSRQPMKPGETRDLKMFIPVLNQIGTTHLVAGTMEEVTLGGGASRSLLSIQQTTDDSSGKPMPENDATLWIDQTGQILKTRSEMLGGMEYYRTTKEAAIAPDGDFDLLAATMIKTTRRIPNAEQTRDVVYKLTYSGGDLAEIFPNDHRQTVQPGSSPGAGTIEVRTDSPTSGPSGAATASEKDIRPNPLVNSDDAQVIAHAKDAVANRTDPWEKAVAIEEWVFKNLKNKNFGTAFASAREVARNLEGDCSEHGVLVAAMCRASGVPCRVVVGLVYVDQLGGFGPHLWNEVYVNGHWVAIDATFNQSQVDATHLKISATSLDGVSPFEAFEPVTRVFNQLKIEPLEIR